MIFLVIASSFFVSAAVCQKAKYQQFALNLHNDYRRMHDAKALKYNGTLGELALLCAKYYSEIHNIDHSCNYKFLHGENLAFFDRSTGAPFTLNSVVDALNGWYVESYDYNYEQPKTSTRNDIYHFTQMVWKSTEHMGFAVFRNQTSNRTYVVALYEPKGNILEYGPDAFKWFRGNVTGLTGSNDNYNY